MSALEAFKVVLDAARDDLKQARLQLARAQYAFDKADSDYQRQLFNLVDRPGHN